MKNLDYTSNPADLFTDLTGEELPLELKEFMERPATEETDVALPSKITALDVS